MQECGKVARVPIIYHHSSKYLVKVPRDSAHPRRLHRTEVPWRPSWPQCTRAGILIHWATSRKSHTPPRIDGHHPCPKACIWVLIYTCIYLIYITISVQLLCPVQLFAALWTASLPGFPVLPWPCPSRSLLRLMPVELVMPYNHLFLCGPHSSCSQSFPEPEFFPRVALYIRWPE